MLENQRIKRSFLFFFILIFALTTILVAPLSYASDVNVYTVKNGDTITSIAKELNVSVDEILRENGLNENDIIQPGATLKISAMTTESAKPAKAFATEEAKVQELSVTDTVTMDFRNADILDVLSAIAVNVDKNIIYCGQPIQVDFSISDVTATTALDYLLKSLSLQSIENGKTIIIGTRETLSADFFNNIALTKFSLKYISSDIISNQIDSLGISVQKIILDSNKKAIWIQGLPRDLGKVRELIAMLDKAENINSDAPTTLMLTPIALNFITAEQLNGVLSEMGISAGMILDSNPKTLWVYGSNNEIAQINEIKKKVDIVDNAMKDNFLLTAVKMNFLTADEMIPILDQLGINVNVITFQRKLQTVWLNGDQSNIDLAVSIIKKFDVQEHINDNVFFVMKLSNITAKEAEKRLEYLKKDGIQTYTFNFSEFSKSLMVFCPSDYKLYTMSLINELDVQTEKIKVPIDFSDVATGMSRLQQRRDLLVSLTGVTSAAFTISTNVARDDGFHYVMYLEETSEVIQRVKDMIKFIDEPLSEGSQGESASEE